MTTKTLSMHSAFAVDVPGTPFSDPYKAKHLFPPEFQSKEIVSNPSLRTSLKEFKMEAFNAPGKASPVKPTHETRLCVPMGGLSNHEKESYRQEAAKRVGPVVKMRFKPKTGILEYPVKRSQTQNVENKQPKAARLTNVSEKLAQVLPWDIEIPAENLFEQAKRAPDLVHDVPATADPVHDIPGFEVVPEDVSSSQSSDPFEEEAQPVPVSEPQKQPASNWISVHHKKQPNDGDSDDSDSSQSDSDSDSSNSILGSDDSRGKVQDEEPPPQSSSDSESSDEPPEQIAEEAIPVKKRKIRHRKAREVESFADDEGSEEFLSDDFVEDLNGKRKKQKAKASGPTKTSLNRLPSGSSMKDGDKPPPQKQSKAKKPEMVYLSPPFDYDELFNLVKLDQFEHRTTRLYKSLRELWLNMLWLAAHEHFKDPTAQDKSKWPYGDEFTGIVLKKARQSIDRRSPLVLRAIYACQKVESTKISGERYRVRFFAPLPHAADIYIGPTSVICDDMMEHSAFLSAHYALHPAEYLLYVARKVCHNTTRLPDAATTARKLYEHIKTNRKQVALVFMDWANMTLLSRFEIFD